MSKRIEEYNQTNCWFGFVAESCHLIDHSKVTLLSGHQISPRRLLYGLETSSPDGLAQYMSRERATLLVSKRAPLL